MHRQTRKAIIIILWLILWQAAAAWMDNQILLVGPLQVLRAFMQNIVRQDFLQIVLYSLVRIGMGFSLALITGLLVGALSYRFPLVEELLAPVVQALKSVPVASFVVLLLIWFGSGRLSFFISYLIVFPNVYVNTIAGLHSADVRLLEMAEVFGMSGRNRFFYIYRPALAPHLVSCLKVSLGMSWKSGVAAEVIGLPDYSLGERLYMSKIYLDTAGLFAWTLTVILISFLFERAVLRLIRAYEEWRPYPTGRRLGAGGAKRMRCGRTGNDNVGSGSGNRTGGGIKSDNGNRVRSDTLGNSSGKTADGENTGKDMGAGQHRQQDVVSAAHICKSYSTQQVLKDYSMTMEKGKRYVLMAPSGAGKTTLLRLLTRLDNIDAGQITGMPDRVGMVFQEDRLCEEYDALCNILLGMDAVKRVDRTGADIIEMVRREAARILPEDCLEKPVRELSGGMRRRVALLRAVMCTSELLILDEPFAGLDEENRAHTAAWLLENLKGRTLLVTTHREEDVELLQALRLKI